MNQPMASSPQDQEVLKQRAYYKETAGIYEDLHVIDKDEHYFALRLLESAIDFYDIRSVLDVGAGTGRVARYLKERHPDLKVVSIEPVQELREVGHQKGLTPQELMDGDATSLALQDGAFDLVCAFGVLHHIRQPHLAVNEMLRVGARGVFISDANNFGQGSFLARSFKQVVNVLGLWGVANWVKTKGKGYTISEGDGLAYSYSVFNDYRRISKLCHMHLFNTQPAGVNPYRTAAHVAVLGIKK